MWERIIKLRDAFLKRRSLPLFRGVSEYVRSRRPGDKFILGLLGCLVVIASLASILTLENSVFVVEPTYGGSLTEGDIGTPRFVNPLLAMSDTDQDLTALTYAGLMGYNADGDLVPVLAQSYTISPDGLTYTFTLRPNATFSDGTPVTASDVVFTVQKAQDPALKSSVYADWNSVSVTALNSRTVQFSLTAPYAPFLQDTTLGILPQHLWQNITDEEFPFSTLDISPVGAGPFVATNVTRDGNGAITRYDLVANKNYALGRPYLDAFHFVFYSDTTSLQTAVNQHHVESAYGVTGPHVITAPYSRVFAVFFNSGENTVLSDEAVRQALSVAIDRNALVTTVLGGYATPIAGPVPAGSDATPLPVPPSNNRIASSTAILTNDGWTYSSADHAWSNASGEDLTVTLKTANVPELQVMAEAVQKDWNQLGVTTTVQLDESGDLAQNVIGPRAFQALLFGMVVGKDDDLYDFWSSKEKTSPGLNISGYSNPDVDKLLDQVRTDTDPAARRKDLSQLNADIAADYPAAFIESPDFVYVVPNDLKGVILPQITSPSDRFATVATWYRRTESVWPFLARQH